MSFQKKILCIGNETSHSHALVTAKAISHDTINHGLITDPSFYPAEFGFYHTSISDISSGNILQNLHKHFDCVTMLDQDINSYPHWKSFVNTFRTMINLEKTNVTTDFRNNIANKDILYWHTLLKTNKSLCVYPWINLLQNFSSASQCQKNPIPLCRIDSIGDWSTAPGFTDIRNNMLQGVAMPDNCNLCYERETNGGESARQFESLEWAMRLKLKTEKDLSKITSPVLYEIRPSNKCNLMCRMCSPDLSSLIEKEQKKHTQFKIWQTRLADYPYDKIDWATIENVYWSGGEPTVMPEFYAFLRKCIEQKHTDFDLTIGTNGMKISDTLLDLLRDFPQVTFSVSFDGYKKVNDYIRWKSDFDTIRNNCNRILKNGHVLAFQTVFSMYNATSLHEVFEFYDREFPDSNSLVQTASLQDNYMGPWHTPLREQALESMYKSQQTKVAYQNGRNTSDLITEMIAYYKKYDHNPRLLKEFYNYNDKLDSYRGSKLVDYIPELAHARNNLF
jgi:pyruvate-formate lyase-activating enzyme